MEKEMNTCLEKGKKKDVKQGRAHYLDQITADDTNVIIRTEFSKGTLLFSEQHDELRDMVAQFGNFMSDVTFVGHSMGGLASINYGLTYAGEHPNKQVNIITVSTPYNANLGGASLSVLKDFIDILFTGQSTDNALESLGGLNNELSDLKNKWNNSNLSNTSLSAISVSMFGNASNWYQNTTGDGVVSLGSQQGDGYKNVNVMETIKGNNPTLPIGVVWIGHAYHHSNTPELSGVINHIDKLMGRAS